MYFNLINKTMYQKMKKMFRSPLISFSLSLSLCLYIYEYVCIYVYVCAYVCVRVCLSHSIHTHTHTHTHTHHDTHTHTHIYIYILYITYLSVDLGRIFSFKHTWWNKTDTPCLPILSLIRSSLCMSRLTFAWNWFGKFPFHLFVFQLVIKLYMTHQCVGHFIT